MAFTVLAPDSEIGLNEQGFGYADGGDVRRRDIRFDCNGPLGMKHQTFRFGSIRCLSIIVPLNSNARIVTRPGS